jgi:hypothetical protein
MAEDNQDQAHEMAREGLRKLKEGQGSPAATDEGRELIEEAKRLDHDAIADIAPESGDDNRDEIDNSERKTPAV